MSITKNLKVSTKLAATSGFAVLLIIGMVANQQISSHAVSAAATTVKNEQTILDGIVTAEKSLGQMRAVGNSLATAASDADVNAALSEAKASSQQAWNGLEKPISIAMVPDVLVEIRENIRLFEGELATTASNRSAQLRSGYGPVAGAGAPATAEVSGTVAAAQKAIEASLTNARRFTDGARADLDSAVASANVIGLIAGLAVIAVLVSSALFLMMTIGRPVRSMTGAMRMLADGDTKLDVPFTDRGDEIGEMAKAVQSFKAAALERIRLEATAQEAERAQMAQRDRQTAIDNSKAEDLKTFVRAVETGFNALSDGDLTVRMTQAVSPEFEPIRAKFNDSVEKLEQTIGAVVGAIGEIEVGLNQITVASADLSQRTEEQAASLEETVAALAEVTRGVNSTAGSAGDAQAAAITATRNAEKGGEIVALAVAAMSRIEESSDKIGKIIGVIDEIAFQTNLLALNAGVEAARAGEAGRGFAVVAQEVRGLAQRSAEAAKEIKDLISTSSAQVSQGVELVTNSGKSLRDIVSQVSDMSGIVSGIAGNAKEQAISLREVSTAADQMDKVTQQNAAMVEQTTAAAQSLTAKTEALAAMVDQFKTRTASAARASKPAARGYATASAASRPIAQMRTTGSGGAAQRVAAKAEPEGWEEF